MRSDAPADQREGYVESSLRLRRFHRFCSLQLAVAQCLRPERPKHKGDADQPDEQAARRRTRMPSRTRASATTPIAPVATPSHATPRWKRPPGSGESPTGCRGSAEPRSRPSLRAIRTSAPATKGPPLLWPRPRTCRSAEPSRAIHHPSCAPRTTPPRMPRRVGWGVDGHMRRHMVAQVEAALDPVDLLVNNAGQFGPIGPIAATDPDQWWQALEVNLRGPLYCARAVLPGMLTRGHGRIINVASGAGFAAIPMLSAHAVSKAALYRLSENLATETRGHGSCLVGGRATPRRGSCGVWMARMS